MAEGIEIPEDLDAATAGMDQAPVSTVNEFLIAFGRNLPNHSESMKGRGKFIRQSISAVPTFRTRQQAYRFAAYLVALADALPDEEGQEGYSFDDVLSAVRNA